MSVYLSCTAQGIQLVTKVYHTFLKKKTLFKILALRLSFTYNYLIKLDQYY